MRHFACLHAVPAGSPSRGGDVAVYVFDINHPSLPTPFYFVLLSISVIMALSTVFHSIKSPDNSPLSHSVLPVLYLPYWSFQLHIYESLLKWSPQWGAADAEIKVPSGENTEFKRSPFKAWSRSVYSHTCYAYCQGFLPYLLLPFHSIHLHFFQNPSQFFLCWLWPTHGFCVGPQNKIGLPARGRFSCWVPVEYK